MNRTREPGYPVCYALYNYDFGDVWVNQGVGDEKAFLKEFKERVLFLYIDKNGTKVQEPKNVLSSPVLLIILFPGTVPE